MSRQAKMFRMSMRYEGDKQLHAGLMRYKSLVLNGLYLIAQEYGAKMEAHGKQNRQWDDRTGNARAGLRYEVEDHRPRFIRIYFAHGVDYGENLETVGGGKYAIIMPTLKIIGKQMMAKVKSFVS